MIERALSSHRKQFNKNGGGGSGLWPGLKTTGSDCPWATQIMRWLETRQRSREHAERLGGSYQTLSQRRLLQLQPLNQRTLHANGTQDNECF